MTMTMTMTTHHLNPSRRLALGALLLGEAMNLLDATVVQVAAPAIHAELGGRGGVGRAVVRCRLHPAVRGAARHRRGRLDDILGRKRLFVAGVAGFTLASVACALAPAVGVLIAFRALQGAAAAVIVPQTIGLIKAMFSGPELSRALGCIGPVMGLAAVCGPVLGGVLTHADLCGSSWRVVFLVNVPLALVVLRLAREPLIGSDLSPGRTPAGGAGAVRPPGLPGRAGRLHGLLRGDERSHDRRGASVQLGFGIGVLKSGLTLAPLSLGLALASWAAGGVRRTTVGAPRDVRRARCPAGRPVRVRGRLPLGDTGWVPPGPAPCPDRRRLRRRPLRPRLLHPGPDPAPAPRDGLGGGPPERGSHHPQSGLRAQSPVPPRDRLRRDAQHGGDPAERHQRHHAPGRGEEGRPGTPSPRPHAVAPLPHAQPGRHGSELRPLTDVLGFLPYGNGVHYDSDPGPRPWSTDSSRTAPCPPPTAPRCPARVPTS
ncbi:conserved hypothetical protein [Streptomyces sviceus ATCC 29083]|uniref:Major facilitator superfamily (MFS) profile domain-containing protein n=1 Tax=Streptomyces sviceus (strain ATCC 29083 / DSM 924 / JCM 4929 / NBRC 13980 / NCIMB 11184 / NRRL 5439 / UC 5370) TaxID=463191 RepID=B5I8W2_STRX2|nr:conserved hypothetical protein [Streptomyces sviceus ATCC 29083]